MNESDKQSARRGRIANFANAVSVRTKTPAGKALAEYFNYRRKIDPKEARRVEEMGKRALAIAQVAQLNGPGLYVDKYLRDFQAEYNNRILKAEGSQMPQSFNILRSFMEPDEKALILNLLPEKYYSASLDTVLEYMTDPKSNAKIEAASKNLEDLVVYELNMLGGYAEFVIPGHNDMVFCGSAVVRDDTELSIMSVFGLHNPHPTKKVMPAKDVEFDEDRQFLLEDKDEFDFSDHSLFGDITFKPILLLQRIDLTGPNVQVRYVMKEKVDSFDIYTDDPNLLEDLNARGREEMVEDQLKEIRSKSDLFSITSQMVPFFWEGVERHEDDITIERQPTQLRLERHKPHVTKFLKYLSPEEKKNFVEVSSITDLSKTSGAYAVDANNLIVETRGYWKTIPLVDVGKDKSGRDVQGKTWVNEQTSWYQSIRATYSAPNVEINITTGPGPDAAMGEIYVMRSAMHPRDTYKVGFTTKTSDERAAQLAATSGQPDQFHVIESWKVKNPRVVEQLIHKALAAHRVNKSREFFRLKYNDIRKVIESIISTSEASLEPITTAQRK